MKLITKTILLFLILSLPLLIASFVFGYKLINETVDENLNERLWKSKEIAEKIIDTLKHARNINLDYENLSSITIDTNNAKGNKFYTYVKMDEAEDEPAQFSALKSYYKKNNVNYLITITQPTLEADDLVENLLLIFGIILALLILLFFSLNIFVSRTLWNPFYKIIDRLNNYDLKNISAIDFNIGSTKEFNTLKNTLNKMSEKIYNDYKSQKEFSENASHEMQTPLAVIKAKIDQLIQSPNLKEVEMKQLEAIENSVNKLSYLNKALLLISKIDNKQFESEETVSINEIVNKVISGYEELIVSKKITLIKQSDSEIKIKLNPILCDILVTNLVQNAIRHNSSDGQIKIVLSTSSLSIFNTGEALRVTEKDLFERFKKNDSSKESLGLGLSIVKSIVDMYNFRLAYLYEDKMHKFTLTF